MQTMDCTDIKVLISGLLDGELGASTRHLAERHLAECQACRALLDEAERIDRRVAAAADAHLEPGGLPPTFEGTVLSRTVYADGPRRGGMQRLTNWLGWLAAAASMGLAITIWMLDGRAAPEAVGPQPVVAYLTGSELKSSVFDGDLTEEIYRTADPGPPVPVPPAPDDGDDPALVLFDRPVAPIRPDDADTLYAASLVLAMLAEADQETFRDIEHIRQITEYDDLLAGLSRARDHLGAEDRPALLAAESILLRLVRGPLSLDDLKGMRQTVATLGLSTQLDAMSDRRPPPASL